MVNIPGLTADDYASATGILAAQLEEPRLREMAAELVGAIISKHAERMRDIQNRFGESRAELVTRVSERAFEEYGWLTEDRSRILREEIAAVEEECRERSEEAAAAARARIAEGAARRREALQHEAEQAIAGLLLDEQERSGHRLVELLQPLGKL